MNSNSTCCSNVDQIYGPNLLGLTLASIQMGLFGLYGLPKEVSHAAGKKDPPLTKVRRVNHIFLLNIPKE